MVNGFDLKIRKEKQLLAKLSRAKQALMADLLTGKVRVTHLLDDEAAS